MCNPITNVCFKVFRAPERDICKIKKKTEREETEKKERKWKAHLKEVTEVRDKKRK